MATMLLDLPDELILHVAELLVSSLLHASFVKLKVGSASLIGAICGFSRNEWTS
jgi:hypothetical protein